MNLKYNTKYGRFSKAFYPEDFDGEKLRKSPEIVSEKGNQAFASALWQFMTPTDPAPSIHDIVFGRWEPNDSDLEQGLERSFGLTTKVIYGDEECGTARAIQRFEIYKSILSSLWGDFDAYGYDGAGDCDQMGDIPDDGAGRQRSFWTKDTKGFQPECTLVNYETAYSLYDMNDYKRCVCNGWGQGLENCQSQPPYFENWS